jgi:hypothetical protein
MRETLVASGASIVLLCCAMGWGIREARAESGEKSLQVTLEVRHGDVWQAIDPRAVLRANDEIRFQFHSSSGGYLYVFNVSSSGKSGWLYPRPEQRQTNRVEPGSTYMIPGLTGSFQIGGDPGYDTTYWVLSPAAVDLREQPPPPAEPQPNTLRPRCGETLLKARGLCLDDRAGPGPVLDLKKVPLPVGNGSAGLTSRDLTFHSQQDTTQIAAPASSPGVILYQFLIAHL